MADATARVTFVGHATVLIQMAGLNILADPLWSDRASPFSFAGPKRVSSPGVSFDALPKIDVVLISHNHYDHLDTGTLARLDARDQPRVVVPLGNLPAVRQAMPASTVSEHDWGARLDLGNGVTLHVEPMLHGSGRGLLDQQATLWAAYVLHGNGLGIYYVGDSGYGDGEVFRSAGRKHGGFDLAILPIGSYAPEQFMADSHMTPAQAVQLMLDAGARRAMAHHFEAFASGFEAYDAPRQALGAALKAASLPADRFVALRPGQALVLSGPP
ncbi:MAG TPA: MBL fold metallo-hydrolase [Rubrivivax sp.]|nr:MBL fold metallo-hydrolase [Rubrivivax sp.]